MGVSISNLPAIVTPEMGDLFAVVQDDVTYKESMTQLATLFATVDSSVASITGTANQVVASSATGDVTLSLPQDIADSSSPEFNNLQLNGGLIKDTNGNNVLGMTAASSAVNYVNVTNSATGIAVGIAPLGSDTDIQINLFSKGAGSVVSGTTATSSQQIFFSGATYQHESIFNYPGTAVTRTYTWPDENGTVALSSTSSGTSPTFTAITAGNINIATNTISSTNSNGNINFIPNGTGVVLVGSSTMPSSGSSGFNVIRVGASSQIVSNAYDNSINVQGQFVGQRSRSGTPGAFVALQNGDRVSAFLASGDDGTNFVPVGRIRFSVDGSVSTGIVPGSIAFLTANSSGVETTALTINSSQEALFTGLVTSTSLQAGNINVATNTISSTNSNGNINIVPNGTGGTLLGSSTYWYGVAASAQGRCQITGVGTDAGFAAGSFIDAAGSAAKFEGAKSRSTTPGVFGIVQNGDELAVFRGVGDDGTQFIRAGAITMLVDGAVSTGIVPGAWRFATVNSGGVNTTALTINSSQQSIFAGLIIPSQTIGIQGTTTNNDAQAGSVGELNSTIVTSGSAVSLTTATPTDIVSQVLQPGDYDVDCELWFDANAATIIASVDAGVNTTSATIPTAPSVGTARNLMPVTLGAGLSPIMNFKTCRITVPTATTATVFLVVNASFSVNSLSAYGVIQARRRR